MTETGTSAAAHAAPPPAPPPPAPPPTGNGTRGWVKVLLACSLAVNLAVVGLGAGAFLRIGGPSSRMERLDMGLGPLTAAMTRADWRAMRPAFMARHPDLKKGTKVLRADFDPVLAALRADDFDPAALDRALVAVAARNAARVDSAREVVADYLQSLPAAARKDYADRLEQRLKPPPEAKRSARSWDGPAAEEKPAAPDQPAE